MKKMSFLCLSLVLLTACENMSRENYQDNSIWESYEIGKMHNEVLAYYESKNHNYSDPGEALGIIQDYLIEVKNYDSDAVHGCIKEISSTPGYVQLSSTKYSDEELDFSLYLNEIEKYFHPSEELMITIEQAFELGESESPEFVRDFVIKNLQKKTWMNIDKDMAYVFSDVLLHSYDYWTTYTIDKKLKKSSLVILYDAGGALHGLIFGPVGSIIEGALLSVAANERIPDDN